LDVRHCHHVVPQVDTWWQAHACERQWITHAECVQQTAATGTRCVSVKLWAPLEITGFCMFYMVALCNTTTLSA
jgi:hypothetical protein